MPKITVFAARKIMLLLLLATFVSCSVHESSITTRNTAPDFELKDLNGKTVALSDFRGEIVLLNFWASWCYPCTYEMPALENIHKRYKKKGVTVLGVGVDDDLSAIKRFQEKRHFSFPILIDSAGKAREAYQLTGLPETFFIDRKGKIIPFTDPKTKLITSFVSNPLLWNSPYMKKFLDNIVMR